MTAGEVGENNLIALEPDIAGDLRVQLDKWDAQMMYPMRQGGLASDMRAMYNFYFQP